MALILEIIPSAGRPLLLPLQVHLSPIIGIKILIRKFTPSAGPLLLILEVDFGALDENSCRQSLLLPHLIRCVGEDPSACLHRGRKIGPDGQASLGVAGLSGGFSTPPLLLLKGRQNALSLSRM